MSLDIFQQIPRAVGRNGILIDESDHIILHKAEGVSFGIGGCGNPVVSGGLQEGIELLIVDVIGPALLGVFLLPESEGSSQLYQVIKEPERPLILRSPEASEEILGILARLSLTVSESGQL
jgi:hypothetical protein